MSKIIGIDLGTTNSAVAVMEGGEPKILENAEGNRTTPSIVAMSKSGERLAGLLAKRQSITNPKNTIFSVKRLIGRKFTDEEVSRDKAWLPYEVAAGKNGGVDVKMGDKTYSPEEISSFILSKIKADAEAKLGEKVTEAVITVPAYFDDSQRQATKNAGEIAGLKVLRLVNEPTAAALAYGLNKKKNEKIVVYDFGGGTFDISVLEVGDDTVEVKSTGGDTHLGGDDFDKKIIEHLVEEYKKQEGIDISKDALAVQRLKEAAERAKHELSTAVETEVNIPYITSDANGPKHFLLKLTRAKLESLVKEYIDHSIELTRETVTAKAPKGAGFQLSEINEVILVGGQTRMPAIVEAVKNLFGKEPHKGINPDEVVAIGAAVQAGILQGDVKDILLLDVTPLTLSIETMGGVATPMIQKNTTVPTAKSQVFSTAADNQTTVEVVVLQGERPMAADNRVLAKFMLDGIPPSPRGTPQVEVTFDIDANGILNVKAMEKKSGKEQSVRVEASSALSKDEIEKLKKEAELHATEDAQKKEIVEAKNLAEQLIYTAEKALVDNGDKVGDDIKNPIKEKIEALKAVKDGTDLAVIKAKTTELGTEIQKIGQAMYNKGNGESAKPDESAGQSTTEGGSSTSTDGNATGSDSTNESGAAPESPEPTPTQ
jgi:molecular chaperone DnaK